MTTKKDLDDHVSDEDLMRYDACSLDAALRHRISDHLDKCESCTKRYDVICRDQQLDSASLETLSPECVLDGRFQIDAILAKGGFGTTYLAHNISTGQKVVIKRQDRTLAQRFPIVEEQRILKQLQHPGIVKALELVVHEGEEFLILQYIQGKPLSLRKRRSFETAFQLMEHLVEAIAYCHERGILHLDISPSNIIIEENTQLPCVIDFGISAHKDAPIRQGAGTPHFMSPERRANSKGDSRSDVYSLGAIFYGLLTGTVPSNTGPAEKQHIKPPCVDNPAVPNAVSTLCMSCLAEEPNARPDSAVILLRRIQRLRSSRKRKALRRAALACISLAAVLVLSYMWRADLVDFVYSKVKASTLVESQVQKVVDRGLKNYDSKTFMEASSYEDLLFEQNPEFVRTLEKLSGEDCKVMLCHAPAGFGKTQMIEGRLNHYAPGRTLKQIDCKSFADSVLPDLVLRGETINTLPVLSDVALTKIRDEIDTTTNGSIVAIDGVDELHQSSFRRLIDMLKDGQLGWNSHNIDIVLLLRPEVLDIACKQDNHDAVLAGLLKSSLTPAVVPRSALVLRVRNLMDYFAKIESKQPNPDKTYVQELCDETNILKVTAKVEELIAKHPFLVDALRVSMHSKLIVEACLDDSRTLGGSESEIKQLFLARAAGRNFASHGRPAALGTDYLSALSVIAANCVPNDEGYFSVPSRLMFEDASNEMFEPYLVLQRSGLVSFSPALGNSQARFEPIWLHSELAAMSKKILVEFSVVRLVLLIIGAMLLWAAAYLVLYRLEAMSVLIST